MNIKVEDLKSLIIEELQNVMETRNKEWKVKVANLRQKWDEYQDRIPMKTVKDVPVFGYFKVDKEDEAIKKLARGMQYNDELEKQQALEKAKQVWSSMSEDEKEKFYKDNYIDDYDQFEKDMDVERQTTIDLDKPSFAQGKPEYDPAHEMTDQRTYKSYKDAAELRRVRFAQTKAEIAIERELMRLWQETADIKFFKSDQVTYTHDVYYKSAARTMGRAGELDDPYDKYEVWLSAQDKPQKSGLSTTAALGEFPTKSEQMGLSGGFGYYVKGHPIFVSSSDLASQTQRMADPDVRKFYEPSGLPKRAAMTKFGKKPEMSRFTRRRMKRKGATDDEIDAMIEDHSDSAILNRQELEEVGGVAQEAVVANWTIIAWYVDPSHGPNGEAFSFFKKYKDRITKPIYIGKKRYNVDDLI
tara:strand:+ start:3685 stop:4926 length:1242 start_codon:yes stop_codon:yes gene_type:complete